MFSDNFYTWMQGGGNEKVVTDALPATDGVWTDEDDKKHPRNDKGEGGGQFKEKPETIEKQDTLSISETGSGSPAIKQHYRDKRDALAHKVTEDGTYDLATGNPITNRNTGYQVSFQEETTEREGHGAYINDDEYDRRVEALSKELGAQPELGRFGEPEISFWVQDKNKALEVARRHNQESVFDWSTFDCIPNKDFVGAVHYADRNNHVGKNFHASKPNPNP